jgi:hypothetical protein
MSLDTALAQKAGKMSSADLRLVFMQGIKKQRHRQQTDRQARAHNTLEILIKMADESTVKVLPMFHTLC